MSKHFLRSYPLYFLLIGILFIACNGGPAKENELEEAELLYESNSFSIARLGEAYVLEVKQISQANLGSETYLLHPKEAEIPSGINFTHQIEIPIESCAISSTTHLGYLEALGEITSIKAASSIDLYYSNAFNQRISEGQLINIGNASFDEEKLISADPEVFFSFALGKDAMKELNDLRQSKIKVIMVSEFLETNPLDKAAWLKFFAAFYGKGSLAKADEIFSEIEKNYQSIKDSVETLEDRPEVFMGYPWKGSWYVSGGNSYMASFIEDAGGKYVWDRFDSEGSVPLDIEVVFSDALKADYWINPGNKTAYSQISEQDQRFSNFEAFQQQAIYSNYKRTSAKGANDCWESGVVHPDLILKDLAAIFHPELFPHHQFFYYQKLSEE